MEMVLNSGFCELTQDKEEIVNGGAWGGAAIGVVLGAGMGMCAGAIKCSYTGDTSDIWKTSAKWAVKNGIKGAFLPF